MMKLLPSKNNLFFSIAALFCVLLVSSISTLAQNTDSIIPINENPEKLLRDVRVIQTPRTGEHIWRERFTGHLSGVDFGFNLLLNEDYSGYASDFMRNDVLHSNSVYINLVQQSIGLQSVRNTIGLVTGLSLHLYNYRLDKLTSIERDENSVIQPVAISLTNVKKSNLTIMSLQMPLLAEFQIPIDRSDNRIYFAAGVYGGIKLSSHTKIKYKIERNEKLKVADHFSIRDLNYGIMVRSGFRWVKLFATYDLVPLFRENRGPELTPFTFGITLVSF